MPQELHVVRCFQCESFQVQIVKKIPKWQCKICGEKQSVKKVYYLGSGRDCRSTVQELNSKHLAGNELRQKDDFERVVVQQECGNNAECLSYEKEDNGKEEGSDLEKQPKDYRDGTKRQGVPSKWSMFLQKTESKILPQGPEDGQYTFQSRNDKRKKGNMLLTKSRKRGLMGCPENKTEPSSCSAKVPHLKSIDNEPNRCNEIGNFGTSNSVVTARSPHNQDAVTTKIASFNENYEDIENTEISNCNSAKGNSKVSKINTKIGSANKWNRFLKPQADISGELKDVRINHRNVSKNVFEDKDIDLNLDL